MDEINLSQLENAYPIVRPRIEDQTVSLEELNDADNLPIDQREVFDHIRDIKDPEHPMSLEELGVVEFDNIEVNDEANVCNVDFTPTIPHCSMATLIGLTIKVQLLRVLPSRFKIEVRITPGSHSQEAAINKQLSDKERVAAALENAYLMDVINFCLLLPEPQQVPDHIKKLLEKLNALEKPKVKYILRSRQPIESYRRWLQIANASDKGTTIFTRIIDF